MCCACITVFVSAGSLRWQSTRLSVALIQHIRWIHESEVWLYIIHFALFSPLNTPSPPLTLHPNLPLLGSTWTAQSHTWLFVMQLHFLISNSTGQSDTYEIFPMLTLATASALEINPLSQCTHTHIHTPTEKENGNATVSLMHFSYENSR